MKQFGIGQPVRRVEDRRFITGRGTYLDDINRPRQAYAFMLRSPYAHARIRAVDTTAAASAPGVLAVFTGEDLARDGLGTIPCLSAVTNRDGSASVIPPHPAIARDRVRHVGDTRRDGGGGEPRRGARRSGADRGRLRAAPGRGRHSALSRAGAAAGVGRGAGQSLLRLGSRRRRRGRAGDDRGAPSHRRSSSSTTALSSIRWSRVVPSANTIRARMPIPCGARRRARISSAISWPRASSRSPKTGSAS